ncbi:MAG: alpha/beta fold hydrolase [Actinomycetota bacterium]|nr:alpha/beta fold hydrolase [Actinomycetota bacterium]MDD5666842.1 alpha/beta fold hydrolase [Actinomycetota bacterium]
MAEEVWPDAEPFSFEGGKTGVLVVHGFTGCTQSMLPLGEKLAAAGFTVLGPRLPGHGTTVKDMGTRTWREWTGEAEKALQELLERCDKVFVTGLSMGGTITCFLGERYADEVAGLMPINAAVSKLNPMMPLTPVVKYVLKTIPGVGSDIKNPDAEESCYDKVPVAAAAELYQLMKVTKADIARITAPILIFSSREDHVVSTANGPFILENVSSTDKELVWLENSYHVATLDNDQQLIVDRCIEFINRLS